MSISNSVESLCKALEDEKIAHEFANNKNNAISGKFEKEKKMRIGAEVERNALRAMRATANVEKNAALGKFNREKEMRIGTEVERDALKVYLRAIRAAVENERVVFLRMNAIVEAKKNALKGRLPLEWIDGYRQTMIDMSVPPRIGIAFPIDIRLFKSNNKSEVFYLLALTFLFVFDLGICFL
ncbi:hypothetical protein LWI29_003845 [Acer saccharum]|uniref:Uncharacterized protein n=1 Tax=Acer saccharum TaxID=4024 RepID=A0AA39TIC7_ACESA|nr:hypothetical protein LWI29_003845 [Acer saccharum]